MQEKTSVDLLFPLFIVGLFLYKQQMFTIKW